MLETWGSARNQVFLEPRENLVVTATCIIDKMCPNLFKTHTCQLIRDSLAHFSSCVPTTTTTTTLRFGPRKRYLKDFENESLELIDCSIRYVTIRSTTHRYVTLTFIIKRKFDTTKNQSEFSNLSLLFLLTDRQNSVRGNVH